MSTGIYGIGISGINAAQLGLLATEHNVVNANTPGYTRQRTVQATNIAVNTGAGAIGQGVHVQTIERLYDRFLTAQVNTSSTKLSEIDAFYSQIKQIDNLLADPSAGLSPALQDFFAGVQQVAANPSLVSARQSMISSSQTLVNRFQSIDLRLSEISNEVNGKITDAVAEINSYAGQIAELNQRIIIAESSYNQPANDLLDQRDRLISDLNGLIKVSTTTNTDGSFNVFIGSGQQLVVGALAMRMTATAASADSSKIVVGLATAGNGVLELPEKLIVGGELGGLVRFRSESLEGVRNELGRLAASIALTFNAQHSLGQDLLGRAAGEAGFNGDFFSVGLIGPQVNPNANNNNTGLPVIQADFATPTVHNGNFVTKLTFSDYRLSNTTAGYTLTRLSDNEQWSVAASVLPATGFTVTRASDGQQTVFGAAASGLVALSSQIASEDGFSISLASGTDAVGNSYLIRPTENAAKNLAINPVIAADTRLVAAATPFRTSATANNSGTGAISAGTGAQGFNVANLPSVFGPPPPPATALVPMTITFNSGSPSNLSFDSLSVGQQIVYQAVGASPVAVNAPSTIPYSQGMTITVAGMSFVMTGSPNNGDSFQIARNTAATSDGRNALALGQLQTQNTVAGGSATFQSAYAQLVAANGIKTRELKVTGEAQQAMLDQAKADRDALSGVNLDEEAANMLRYQQAYQASAKLLEVGKTLFDTIIQIG